jgi:hypothetical protein
MHVPAIRPIMALIVCSMLLGATALGARADDPPMVDGTPTFRGNLPTEFCTPEEIELGNTGITESPMNGALVKPADTPGRDLFLLVITMPPGSCVGYGSHYLHNGAVVWYVQEGSIEFATQPVSGLPAATVAGWDATQMPIAISDTPASLEAGAWISIDRAAEYSYRNAGPDPAVVLMAANEVDPFAGLAFSCKGGCRKR